MRLIKGDCLQAMDELIAEGVKVDAIITDPPYLIGYKTNYRKDKTHRFNYAIQNDDTFDFGEWAIKVNKLLKDNTPVYVFCSWKKEPVLRKVFSELWNHKNNIVWIKNNWTAGDLKAQYGQQYEIISLYNKGRSFFRNKRFADVWEFDRVAGKNQVHQNQKPIDLMERIVTNSTNKGDTILDPFMGSGSTGVACKNTERDFIGIELDDKYFDIAKERIEQSPVKLF